MRSQHYHCRFEIRLQGNTRSHSVLAPTQSPQRLLYTFNHGLAENIAVAASEFVPSTRQTLPPVREAVWLTGCLPLKRAAPSPTMRQVCAVPPPPTRRIFLRVSSRRLNGKIHLATRTMTLCANLGARVAGTMPWPVAGQRRNGDLSLSCSTRRTCVSTTVRAGTPTPALSLYLFLDVLRVPYRSPLPFASVCIIGFLRPHSLGLWITS